MAAAIGARVRRAAAQAVSQGVVTDFSWDTEDEDTHGFWSSGTTLTVPAGQGGIYAITVQLALSQPAEISGEQWVRVVAGGVEYRRSIGRNYEDSVTVSCVHRLADGETVIGSARHNRPVAMTMTGRLHMFRLDLA